MRNYIKYPIALNKKTKDLVEINEVTPNNSKGLICKDCNDDFIAVLKHQTPHFKHKPNSICRGNEESYIHWVTKEVFKEIKEIELPELFIDDLPEKYREKFQIEINQIIDSKVPQTFRYEFREGLKKYLFESRKLLIDRVDIEKEFKTKLGNIRVDIVAITGKKEIFIEPFFTSKIDETKKDKLSIIDIPTLSLDLLKFKEFYNSNFSIQKLKEYVISEKSKKWIYISNRKYDRNIENYANYLLKEIETKKSAIDIHKSKINKIEELQAEYEKKNYKIAIIREKMDSLLVEIKELKKEVGIDY